MRAPYASILFLLLVVSLASSESAAQSMAAPPAPVLSPGSMLDPGSAWGATISPPSACMATLSPASMERQAVYLDARMAQGTSEVLLNEADLLASDVATSLNSILTAPGSPLARTAAQMKYYSVPAELLVVARRGGAMTWRGVSLSGDSSAFMILGAALDSARHHGTAVMLWPDDLRDDSLVIRLSLMTENFPGATVPGKAGDKVPAKFPAFAIPTPRMTTPPRLLSDQISYVPFTAHPGSERVSGNVQVNFLIDTAGKVVMPTLHDRWPAGTPRLTGKLGAYYDQLLGRVKAFEQNASYSPAKVGSCRISSFEVSIYSFDGTYSTDRYAKWE